MWSALSERRRGGIVKILVVATGGGRVEYSLVALDREEERKW